MATSEKMQWDVASLDHMMFVFRRHLRLTTRDNDSQLQIYLRAAITAAEHEIGCTILTSNITLTSDFSSKLILRRPLSSVASVEVDGTALAEDDYEVDGSTLTFGDSVSGDTVTVAYVAGMDPIPSDIVAAILLHGGALFANPLDTVETLPKASRNLLRPYRSWGLDAGK